VNSINLIHLFGVQRLAHVQGLYHKKLYSGTRIGDRIRVDGFTQSGLEVVRVYVQLGSCLEQGLEPYLTRSHFYS
jgi:hypothetical protein